MIRSLIAGTLLLFFGTSMARRKQEPVIFIFCGIDSGQSVALLRPMSPPDIGVQLDSASGSLKPGEILRCKTKEREHQAIVEGDRATITDLTLECGEYKFVVKGIVFSPEAQ